jgi:hypothetical protein
MTLEGFDIVLLARRQVPELGSAARIERFFEPLPQMDQTRYWRDVDDVLSAVTARLLADPKPSYARWYRYFMETYAARHGPARFGEKTPWNVRHLEQLVAMFPRCRILHMVRDLRAVVASKRRLPRTSRDVVTNAIKWRIDVEAAHRFKASNPCARDVLLELRYEDLVADPEPVLRRICEFIGEPFAADMFDFHASENVMFTGQHYHAGVFRPVFTSSVTSWAKDFSSAQVRMIDLIAGRMIRLYGYEPIARCLFDMVRLPVQAVREVAAWLAFKREEAALRKHESNIRFRTTSDPQLRLAGEFVRRRSKRP